MSLINVQELIQSNLSIFRRPILVRLTTQNSDNANGERMLVFLHLMSKSRFLYSSEEKDGTE